MRRARKTNPQAPSFLPDEFLGAQASCLPSAEEPNNSANLTEAIPEDLTEDLSDDGRLIALTVAEHETGQVIAAFAPALIAGRRLYCLDGGNVFNPYRLSIWCRREGLDPTELLARIFVSRAYTCHQLATAVETMLAPLAQKPDPPMAAILGIETLFLDEDLPLFERNHLFEKILNEAERLKKEGLPLLITTGAEENPARNPWARRVAKKALMLGETRRAVKRISISASFFAPALSPPSSPCRKLIDYCSVLAE